jgi:PAS domain S-box-containing protein
LTLSSPVAVLPGPSVEPKLAGDNPPSGEAETKGNTGSSRHPRPPRRVPSDPLPAKVDLEREGRLAFWAVFDAHFAEIIEAQRAAADQTTATKAVLAAIDPAEQESLIALIREAMRRALAEGDWTEYDELQRARGAAFAREGLPVIELYRVVAGLQLVIRPYLLEAYGADDERLGAAYAGLTEFLIRTIVLTADEFVQTKETIISTQDQELALGMAERERAEHEYKVLFEGHPQPLLVYDPATLRILELNDAAMALYGYTVEEVPQLKMGTIMPLDDREEMLQRAAGLGKFFQAGPWRHRKKDGTMFEVASTSHEVVFKGRPARVVMVEDLSDKERLERELRDAARQSLLLLESAGEGIYGVDLDGRCMFVNRAALQTLGFTSGELLGHELHALIHHHHPDGMPYDVKDCPIGIATQTGQPARLDDEVLWRKDGTSVPVEYGANPIVVDGTIRGAIVTFTDISRRRTAELALRESEASFKAMFADHPRPMWVYDRETLRFLEVNNAAVAIYGYSGDEFKSMRLTDIRPPGEVAKLLEDVSLDHDEPIQDSGPWQHIKKDGTIIDVLITSHRVAFAGREARIVIAEDVTERERLERQLRLSQRMESLGQLAGGVAHDFNNLLGVIINYAAFVKEQVVPSPAGDPIRWEQVVGDVAQIEAAAERARQLVHQLLAFARQEVARPEVLNINDVVTGIEPLLRRTLGEHIDLQTTLSADPWLVKMDAGQLEQVLVNLAVNARDAMPRGGALRIDSENVDVDEAYAASRPGAALGRSVRLRVSDTGSGMDATVVQQAFDPFFTTKPKGEGTGLGLATVYGIITQAGGRAQIYSEPGHGTTVTALLPATDEARSPALALQPDRHTGGKETILVVEDEDALREVTRRLLERNGYDVLLAARGRDALELLAEQRGEIQLLLTDVIMPEMLGREVAIRAQSLRPGIRVLFVSGYAQTVLGTQGTLDMDVALLEKPFSETQLLAKVREVLDSDA